MTILLSDTLLKDRKELTDYNRWLQNNSEKECSTIIRMTAKKSLF
jgi:hypothetical protein